MSAGDSPTSISNIALVALGEDPVTSLDENSKNAILCKARYNDIRRGLLESHPWPFAMKQAQWAEDPDAPLFQWGHRYRVPADFIRFYGQSQDRYDMAVWVIMSGFLYTNDTAPLDVLYIWDQDDATKFPPLFVHTLAYEIAMQLGVSITQNMTRVEAALRLFEGKLSIARFSQSQQRAPTEWDVDVLLRSRY